MCSKCKLLITEKLSGIFTRASQHMGNLNMTGKRIKNTKELAISDYLLQCDIPITFNDFDILAFDSNKFKLLIKESLLMKCV